MAKTSAWKLKYCLAIFSIATFSHLAGAQTLYDYYSKALTEDPDYAAARANFQSEVRSRELAGSAMLPSISLSMSSDQVQYQRQDLNGPATKTAAYSPRNIGIKLMQPIFNLDRLAFMKENEARAVRAEWVLAQAKQDLALRVVQTAFNYLLGLDQLTLAQAQAQAVNAQLTQLEALLTSRSSTRTEVADARARHELSLVQVRQAQSQLEVKKLEFIKLAGEAPSLSLKPLTRSPVMQAPQPLSPETWINAAREQSYKVLAQRANVQLAKASIDRVKAGFYPTVSLVASRQQSYGSNYFTDNERTDSVGVQLSMSLFDGGNTQTLTAQAVSQTERATNELRSIQEDAAIGAGQAYWGVVNGMEQVKAMELAVDAAELALQGTRLGIKANVKTYADELNAVQLLFATRRDLQKERYTYLLSRTQLLWSAGLSEKDLAELLMSLLDDNLPNVLSLGSN